MEEQRRWYLHYLTGQSVGPALALYQTELVGGGIWGNMEHIEAFEAKIGLPVPCPAAPAIPSTLDFASTPKIPHQQSRMTDFYERSKDNHSTIPPNFPELPAVAGFVTFRCT